MKYFDNYDFDLQYHPIKANVVVDAHNRKPHSTLASIAARVWKMLQQLRDFDVHLAEANDRATLFAFVAQPTLLSRVLEAQQSEYKIESLQSHISRDKAIEG